MLKPRALCPGDCVAVVAPASPFPRDAFARGVAEIERLGFRASFDARVFDHRGYVAGEAAGRARSFTEAWQDESIGAIMVARGGYGSVQLLPHLDRAQLTRAPKILVGYSDVTSLLSFVSLHCGVTCFHGPSVAGCLGRGPDAYDATSLVRALTCAEPLGAVAAGVDALKPGEASGPLFGGTLTQIAASLGTPFAFDPPAGFVLLLDEVGERPYRLDRMLVQLTLAGILARASAIVFNALPGCDEPGGRPTAKDTVLDVLRDFPGPIVFGVPTGHVTGPALTVPLGVRVRVVASGAPQVVFEESAVVS